LILFGSDLGVALKKGGLKALKHVFDGAARAAKRGGLAGAAINCVRGAIQK
jgi:hypothetical protein